MSWTWIVLISVLIFIYFANIMHSQLVIAEFIFILSKVMTDASVLFFIHVCCQWLEIIVTSWSWWCLWCPSHCGHQPADFGYCHYMIGFNLELRQTFKFTSSWDWNTRFTGKSTPSQAGTGSLTRRLQVTVDWLACYWVLQAAWKIHGSMTSRSNLKPAAAAWVGQWLGV